MDSYYATDDLLSCGHFPTDAEPEVWWTILPAEGGEPSLGGTTCTPCATITEACGGTASLIPTADQILNWLDLDNRGIGTD